MSQKVVNIAEAREQRANRQAQAEAWLEESKLPPEVEGKLNEENEKVLALVNYLNTAMDAYGESMGESQSTLVAVEALARMLAGVVSTLDAHVHPNVLQDQVNLRSELSDQIHSYMVGYASEYAQTEHKPVFQHDLYLGLIGSLLTTLFDHRLGQIVSTIKREATSSEEAPAKDVQEDGGDGTEL